MHRGLGLVFVALAACSSDPAGVEIAITTGHEEGVMAQDPPVTRLLVTADGSYTDGTIELSAETTPGGTFDLGEVPEDAQLSFEVTGFDADGAAVVRGRSLSVVVGAARESAIVVFAQRVGAFARPPGGLGRAHVGGPAGIMGERYLLSTGGAAFDDAGPVDASLADFYDLLTLGGAESPSLPHAAQSMVIRGAQALLVEGDSASVIDFETGSIGALPLPAGLEGFGAVAGGHAVETGGGATYVVGGTRADAPSRAVLRVNADGTLTAFTTAVARTGAAATWVEGVGLVVIGGAGEAPGVEILGDASTSFTGPDWPADPVAGAAAALAGPGQVVVLGGIDEDGGAAPTRTLELTCGSDCTPQPVDGAGVPDPIERSTAFALADGSFLVVGARRPAPGATVAFRAGLAPAEIADVPLREARRGATVTATPNGAIGVLGGIREDESPVYSVEMFFPP